MAPDRALWRAVLARLRVTAPVTDLVDQRIFDEPPPGVTFPYLRLGQLDIYPVRGDGVPTRWEVRFGIEVYSLGKPGRFEAKEIGYVVTSALDEAVEDVQPDGYALSWLRFDGDSGGGRANDGESYKLILAYSASVALP